MSGSRTRRWVRPSTTQSRAALLAKSLLNAALFFAIFMVALPWIAHRLLPVALPLPGAVASALGGLLFVGGIALWLASLEVFSRRAGGTPFPLDAPRQLATSGPFARTRNPIMAGELAVIWGLAVYLANLGVLLYAVAITVAAHLLVVLVEEPELRARFGSDYVAYTRRVPRWVPRRRADPPDEPIST